jgi:Tol biopolymer transport system component
MKRFSIAISIAGALFAFGAGVNAQVSAEVALRTAIERETVKGDLKGAIDQYKKLAQGKDRAVAAKALLHMADCYRKMGDADARKVYERIVREFADQPEAVAAARVHLDGSPTSAAATRRVWTVTPEASMGYSSTSADGRQLTYIVYRNRGSAATVSNLFVRDLVTGASRQVTDAAAENSPDKPETYVEPEESAFSRDGKRLAYAWLRAKDNRYELRVVDLTGSGIPQFRRLFASEDVQWIGPDDWSPDGKWIAVQLYRKNGPGEFALVSVADGSLRVLKSRPDHRGAKRLIFSPDGRYLAYDLFPDENAFQRNVFVMPLDGGPEVAAVVSPSGLVGWSPDGSRLIFRSDRTGSMAFWSQAIVDGKPKGSSELLRRDIGDVWPIRLTPSGALLTIINNGLGTSFRVADFDFAAAKFLSQPVDPVQAFVGTNSNPAFAPGGKSLAYLSRRQGPDLVLAIRSMDTGKVLELHPRLRFLFQTDPAWSPDGRAVAVSGIGLDERPGIYRVDVSSGAVSPIALSPERHRFLFPAWSSDGTKIYYYDNAIEAPIEPAFIERDLSTGRDREVIRRPNLGAVNLSPDGKFIVTGSLDAAAKAFSVLLIPTIGNQVKELMRTNQAEWGGVWGWAPDSQSFLVRKKNGNVLEVWRVSLDGSAPQKTDLQADPAFGALRASSNGRQVAFQVQEERKPEEVWVTENFLRASKEK